MSDSVTCAWRGRERVHDGFFCFQGCFLMACDRCVQEGFAFSNQTESAKAGAFLTAMNYALQRCCSARAVSRGGIKTSNTTVSRHMDTIFVWQASMWKTIDVQVVNRSSTDNVVGATGRLITKGIYFMSVQHVGGVQYQEFFRGFPCLAWRYHWYARTRRRSFVDGIGTHTNMQQQGSSSNLRTQRIYNTCPA